MRISLKKLRKWPSVVKDIVKLGPSCVLGNVNRWGHFGNTLAVKKLTKKVKQLTRPKNSIANSQGIENMYP